jgi:hypothetical protein
LKEQDACKIPDTQERKNEEMAEGFLEANWGSWTWRSYLKIDYLSWMEVSSPADKSFPVWQRVFYRSFRHFCYELISFLYGVSFSVSCCLYVELVSPARWVCLCVFVSWTIAFYKSRVFLRQKKKIGHWIVI